MVSGNGLAAEIQWIIQVGVLESQTHRRNVVPSFTIRVVMTGMIITVHGDTRLFVRKPSEVV